MTLYRPDGGPVGSTASSGNVLPYQSPHHSHTLPCMSNSPKGFGFFCPTTCVRFCPAVSREFPDHHAYTRADVESLAKWAKPRDVAAVVSTHKDLVKLGVDRLGDRPLRAVTIGIEFLAGQDDVEAKLQAVSPRRE